MAASGVIARGLALLDLEDESDRAEVRRRRWELLAELHPDRGGDRRADLEAVIAASQALLGRHVARQRRGVRCRATGLGVRITLDE